MNDGNASLLPADLPSPLLESTWRVVTPEFERTKAYWPEIQAAAMDAARKPGWNPKTVKMAGYMVAIDYSFHPRSDRVSSYKTVVLQDHPFLATLPSNAPRAVRHIYRKDVRLKYLRADDGWDFCGDLQRAEDAWAKYNTSPARGHSAT
jgi:hypothetical protein